MSCLALKATCVGDKILSFQYGWAEKLISKSATEDLFKVILSSV